MLFQATNIIPDTRTGIGYGTVDVTRGIQFSWQVNGNYPVMTAFSITIYRNDTASTQLYTTGRTTTNCPFNGRDASGEIDFFSYSITADVLSAAGIANGNEYKYTIRQYYTDAGAETSILQSSASVFITRATPSFAFSAINVTAAEHTFTVNYSQAQGDTVEWIRYQLQVTSGSVSEELYDSGKIFGTPVYTVTYSGLLNGGSYSIRATGQTSSGVEMDTGWVYFTPSYSTTALTADFTAACMVGLDAVKLDWTGTATMTGQDIWIVYRQKKNSLAREKLTQVSTAITTVYDFSAESTQGPYTYYLYAGASGTPTAYLSDAAESNSVNPTRYQWTVLECEPQTGGTFLVLAEYDFRHNLSSGAVSNNNSPGIQQNFTAMPTVQPSPQNYRSGTLSALTGSTPTPGAYTDGIDIRNALMALSVTSNTVFIKSSRGDMFEARTSGPVQSTTAENTQSLAQTVSLPWVEINSEPAVLLAYNGTGVLDT